VELWLSELGCGGGWGLYAVDSLLTPGPLSSGHPPVIGIPKREKPLSRIRFCFCVAGCSCRRLVERTTGPGSANAAQPLRKNQFGGSEKVSLIYLKAA